MNDKERFIIRVGGPSGGVGKSSSVSLLEEFYSHYKSSEALKKASRQKALRDRFVKIFCTLKERAIAVFGKIRSKKDI